MTTQPPLDETSRAIIRELQQDGRRPYSAIGKAVGLSETATRQRVHRLLASGVVQVAAVTDPARMGLTRQAMIGVRADGDVQSLADALAGIPEVAYVVITAGTFDLLAEVICEDDDQLLTILNDQIRSLPGVLATETFVYLRIRKQTATFHRS